MEIALIIYGIGFVVMLFILLWLEEWHPVGFDGDCLFIMSMSSWIGVFMFIYICSNRTAYKFSASGNIFSQCIPFEGNEHLLGTTDMCPEEYINW